MKMLKVARALAVVPILAGCTSPEYCSTGTLATHASMVSAKLNHDRVSKRACRRAGRTPRESSQ